MLFRRHAALADEARAALVAILQAPTFELVPLRGAFERAAGSLPPGAAVAVTASPAKGMDATLDLAERLRAAGFRPVPHLSARMVRDRAHLSDLLARFDAIDVRRVFVVGGDAKEPGDYPDGLSLLRAMSESGHPFTELGIPCYPEGHSFIADGLLLDALHAKAPFASYMTTQMCFDPGAIARWISARRAEGMTLPIHLGVPGVAEPGRLLAIASRIGVADTHRFLVKNTRFIARLLRSGGFYRPDGLLQELAPIVADEIAEVVELHMYTFNAVAEFEAWRKRYLERLGASMAA
jgi:methylenetetrahydrofolate reductase (NADPH)